MDGSSGKDEAEGGEVMAVEIADPPANTAGAPAPRRSGRCVQKKLDFYGARGGAGDPEEEEEESDRERRGKRKRKGAERAAAPRKPQVPSSGKESQQPIKNASHFFMRISEKKQRKKLEMEHQIPSPLGDECGKALHHIDGNYGHNFPCGQVRDSRNHRDATHKKSRSPFSGEKLSNAESIFAKSPGTKMVDKNQPILDLWFQAKIDAEENQRLSAGKNIHPFFSNWKASKKMFETSEIDNVVNRSHLSLFDQCPPIHVFETQAKETTDPFNWSNWNLNHMSLLSSDGCFAPYCSSAAVNESSVEPLRFGSDISVPNLGTDEGISMDPLLNEMERSSQAISSSLTNSQEAQRILLSYLKEIHGSGNTYQSIKCCSPNGSLTNVLDKQLHERLISYQLHRDYDSDHYLWTSKYRPENASEVCGNVDAVKIISDWLQSWHEQYFQKSKSSVQDKVSMATNGSCSSFESYYETESEEEGDQLGNVLLVTGPVGCGKSAAIYACAKEKGFEVIEVNASDQRNGTLVKQKFGEATESHGLDICSVKGSNNWDLEGSHVLNLAHKGNITTASDDPEVTSWTCSDFRVHDFHGNTIDGKATMCQVTNRTLLLFDDVDTVFDEDRGFLGTILRLAETSKRPIILTTNSKDPELPRLLVRQAVDFILPSHEELLSLVSLICAAEKVLVSPLLLKRLIKSCQADIRKTISNLQFWCQGEKGRDKHSPYRSLQFDLDAVHLVIPRIIPWGFPCKLSEFVAEEIKGTILAMKEKPLAMDAVKQECNSMKDVSTETDANKNNAGICSITNFKKTLSPLNDDETSDFSCSPIKFIRRNKVFKTTSALSSDSGEEHSNDFLTEGDRSEFTNHKSPDISLVPLSFSIGCNNNAKQLNVPVNESESQELIQCPSWPSGAKGDSETWENNVSVNVSCIPESEFVSSSELDCRVDHFPIASDEAFVSPLKSMHTCNEKINDDAALEFSIHPPSRIENACHYAESVHGTEDLQDLEIGRTEFQNIGGPFVDECSRADFGVGIMPVEKEHLFEAVETVQETWMRLHNSCQKLKSYLTNDQMTACQTLKHVGQMANLVSDADIMLSGCTSITNDFIRPNMIPCSEPHSMSWSDQLLEMASIFGEHGLCHYVKSSTSDLKSSCEKVDLTKEILGCSSSLMVLGKLLSQGSIHSNLYGGKNTHLKESSGSCLERGLQVNLCNSILPMIPLKSCMALKGHAFHEYLSSLSQISKLENSRLSQRLDGETRERRVRASQHYLQAYPFSLSPEDVALLAQQCCFGDGGFG